MNTNTVIPAFLQLNIDLTDEQFFQLCQNNRYLRFERTATGEVIIMPPTGSETGDSHQGQETIPGGYHTSGSTECCQSLYLAFVLARGFQLSSLGEVQSYQELHHQR